MQQLQNQMQLQLQLQLKLQLQLQLQRQLQLQHLFDFLLLEHFINMKKNKKPKNGKTNKE